MLARWVALALVLEHAQRANNLIATTTAAKTNVEQAVPTLTDKVEALLSSCALAEEPLKQLKSEFAPDNFADVASNIEASTKLAGEVSGVVSEITTPWLTASTALA